MNLGEQLIILAGIIWGAELIPQLIKTIKSKKTEDLSLIFFILCTFAYVCYLIGNIILKNWIIVLAHIPSMVLNGVMSYLIIKYRRK